jgi:putative transposase
MIDPKHDLSITRQSELLGISRAAVYYVPRPIPEADLRLQRRIDALHLEHPFAGARMLRDLLKQEGIEVGRKHVATLMRRMGIEALVRRQSTSRRAPGHEIYPYRIRNVAIERPNQVWALDITYIPMRRGFVYFVAVMDWATRRILAHRLSNTLTADFCVEALDEAISRYGVPEIVNTDQGSQFTGSEFIGKLQAHQIAISMDGKGCWRDNVFVERFWKTLKYEEVYLRAYETVSEARESIGRYVVFYNQRRPHRALKGCTPDAAYFAARELKAAA